ncbi:MAG: TatD family hydrolase [Candidatus Brocadiales bacterium]
MLVDTHTHLNFPDYKKDSKEVINRAVSEGVERLIEVGTDVQSSKRALDLAQEYPLIYASVGIHPHDATSSTEKDWQEIKALAQGPKVVAIGETGLDYHYNYSTKEDQWHLFERHLELALELDLPVIIHNREATEDCLNILRKFSGRPLKGTFHCFSGSKETAKECISMGFYISFAGTVTFPNAHRLREVVKSVPVERLLLETDSPFLAPQPRRGKRNEPAYLRYVLPVFARLYGLSEDDIARITTFNALGLFGLGARDKKQNGKIAYKIRNSLYLNITNCCPNSCSFCPREDSPYVKGHYLGLDEEPSSQEIINTIEKMEDVKRYDEVVFCGYGEPTERLDVIETVAKYLREKGAKKIRLNTNGQGDLLNSRSTSKVLEGLIDSVCISLNSANSEDYKKLCSPKYGNRTYSALLNFARTAREKFPEVTLSVVDVPGLDTEACKQIACELGVGFRIRGHNDLG